MAPYQGAIYFRPHANGSMVQFHNSFWSKLDSGEVFTIDQPLLDVRTSGMTLLIDQKGNISSCDGRYCLEMQESLVDKNLFQLCPDSHSSFIANAISCAVYGKCYFNLFTKFSNDPRNVTMDFHPSVTGQVVVSVSIVRESVDAAKLPGTPDCGADGDTETRSVPSAAHGHVIPTENEVYCLGKITTRKPCHSFRNSCKLLRKMSRMSLCATTLREMWTMCLPIFTICWGMMSAPTRHHYHTDG